MIGTLGKILFENQTGNVQKKGKRKLITNTNLITKRSASIVLKNINFTL